jgi:hypothetical protein
VWDETAKPVEGPVEAAVEDEAALTAH